jgi:ankyrin repeat protein
MSITIDDLVVFAARSSNLSLLKERLSQGGDPSYNDCEALRAAAYKGNEEAIEILLQAGANPNGGKAGFGALEIALRFGGSGASYKLLCAGAKLRRTTRQFYRERLKKVLEERGS